MYVIQRLRLLKPVPDTSAVTVCHASWPSQKSHLSSSNYRKNLIQIEKNEPGTRFYEVKLLAVSNIKNERDLRLLPLFMHCQSINKEALSKLRGQGFLYIHQLPCTKCLVGICYHNVCACFWLAAPLLICKTASHCFKVPTSRVLTSSISNNVLICFVHG